MAEYNPGAYTPSETIRLIDELAETLRHQVGSLQDYFAAVRQTEGDPLEPAGDPLATTYGVR